MLSFKVHFGGLKMWKINTNKKKEILEYIKEFNLSISERKQELNI